MVRFGKRSHNRSSQSAAQSMAKSKAQPRSQSRARGELDSGLLLIVFLLFGLGLVQVYSSSFILAAETRGDSLFFIKKQLIFTGVAVSALLFFTFINWKRIRSFGPFLWGTAVLGILLTLIPGIGHRAGGAVRWLDLHLFRFEPSELLKVSLPLIFGKALTSQWHSNHKVDLAIKVGVLLLPVPFLLFQPDFGTTFIYLTVLLGLVFIFGLRWRYILFMSLGFVISVYVLIMNSPYRKARFVSYLDPWSDATKSGFQVIQSLLSFSSGGLTGTGLGEGQGKLFFLPEAHTDFTLAVLGEEMGFSGVSILMVLYGFLILRAFQIGIRVKDKFTQAVVLGLAMLFSLQVLLNVGVVLGLLPTKGLTLPFLSYGGSSLVVMGVLFGILVNAEKTHLRSFY